MKKILNPYLNKEGYNCVCCAPNNPVGLHLEFWEENEDVLTIWKPGENYQGWVNTLHGGIISMLMDEVAGWVINRKLQTTGVTMQLNVKYKFEVLIDGCSRIVRSVGSRLCYDRHTEIGEVVLRLRECKARVGRLLILHYLRKLRIVQGTIGVGNTQI